MKKIIATILVSSCLIFSCSNSPITPNQNLEKSKPVLTNDETTKTEISSSDLDVNIGEEFTIVLEGNATTGYQWSTEKVDANFIEFIGSKYEPSSLTPGSGGKYVWTFKTLTQGKTDIIMKYARSWEKEIEPIKKQTFVVTIKEPIINSGIELDLFGNMKKRMGL